MEDAPKLRRGLQHVRDELLHLSVQLGQLRRRTRQLSVLRDEERDAGVHIAHLERVLDFARVAAHLREVVAEPTLRDSPVPHLHVLNLLPADVYEALVGAIPAPVFFERRGTRGQELRVPPRLAPTHSMIAWMFITNMVLRQLSALLLARFQQPLLWYGKTAFPGLPPFDRWDVEITLSKGRIVRRRRGDIGAAALDRPWDLLTGVLDLGRPCDNDQFGSCLRAAAHATDAEYPGGASSRSLAFPFCANSLLTFLGPARAHKYVPIPETAEAKTERYSYEFGIAPTRAGRRRLAALLDGIE